MTVYVITAANWDDPAFWAAISEGAGGHELDFSALPSNFDVDVDKDSGRIVLTDGSTTFTVGESGYGGASDATLAPGTLWDFFETLRFGDGDHRVIGDAAAETITTGAGNDTIDGQLGQDTINSGAGNDAIYGDGAFSRESLNWQDFTTAQAQSGFTTTTNGVDVTFRVVDDTGITLTVENATNLYVADVEDDGTGTHPDSGLKATAADSSASGVYEWSFSEPVTNVSFSVSDLDARENLQIFAYDAQGNRVELTLDPGVNVTVSDTNGDGIDDFADGNSSGGAADSLQAITVSVPGPVSRIEAIHTLDSSGGLGIHFSELFFDVVDDTSLGDGDLIIAGDGADTVFGEGGNDTIDGGDGADLIYGGDGADVIDAGTGSTNNDDTVYGGAGDDTITSSSTVFDSDDVIYGEAGNDHITGSGGADLIDGGTGDDTLIGGTDWDTLIGGEGDDSLDGQSLRDSLLGGAGNDTLRGGTDVDYMDGGDDADLFLVEQDFTTAFGEDTIIGGEGFTTGSDADTIDFSEMTSGIDVTYFGDEFGTAVDGSDTITFSEIEALTLTNQNDTLDAGNDSVGVFVEGLDGDDSLLGGAGDDTLLGGDGNDTLVARNNLGGGDLLDGGAGDDELTDSFFNATLEGGDGADLFNVGFGEATVTGGEGGTDNDTLSFADADDTANVLFTGNEAGTYTDDDGDSGTFSEIEAFTLTSGNDSYNASAASSSTRADAGAGNDNLTGGDGDDTLNAGTGADTVEGRTGNDSIDAGTGDGAVDTVVLSDGDGDDTITGFEGPVAHGDGTFTGQDQLDLSGLTDANGALVNTRDVTVGNDGSGNALLGFPNGESVTLVGIAPADVTSEDALAAMGILQSDDIISGTASGERIDASYLGDAQGDMVDAGDSATGTDDDSIEAGGGNDTVVAGAGNDTVLGGAGADSLDGGIGNDSIDAGSENDTVLGWTGNDSIAGGTGNDVVFGQDGNDTIFGGAGADSLDGDDALAGADQIFGEAGNDTIIGDGGNDTLSGGDDNDLIFAGDDDDSVSGGDGNDQIFGEAGHDSIEAGSGDDTVSGGDGNDTIYGGTGNDSMDGGTGLNDFYIEDGWGDDTILSTTSDELYFQNVTADLTITLTGAGSVAFTDGTNTGTATGTGSIYLGQGNDYLDLSGLTSQQYFYTTAFQSSVLAPGGMEGQDTIIGSAFDDNFFLKDGLEGDFLQLGAGNDYVEASDGGDDTIYGEAGNDELRGFGGDDYLDGGDGDDLFYNGDGNDTYIGGVGNDTIWAEDGEDQIHGGTGNDSMEGGNDADTFFMENTFGTDIILGGEGGNDDDRIDASAVTQDLTLDLSQGDAGSGESGTLSNGASTATFSEIESVTLGDGNDVVIGSDGADNVTTGDGDDTVNAGDGADSLDLGGGNDSVIVDQGDTVLGGTGDDYFTLQDLDSTGTGNAAISIIGGEGGETDGDTLQLTPDVAFSDITFTNTDDAADGLSGSFTMADGTSVTFAEIENIICFTPGTRILTGQGERPIETLRIGDLVVTRDQGLRPIRWIGRRTVPGHGRFAPVRVGMNAHDSARRGLLVSQQHRILFTGYHAELLFGEPEVLVAAKHLVDGRDVIEEPCQEVTYIHIMFDHHEVIYAEGIATESFHAGDVGLSAVSGPARDELFAIFPELRSAPGHHLETARTCLKRHEAQLLVEAGGP